ncbi:hypothetical protein CC80DRAFT_531779 [Byssothecium circinans]|uniref:Uncharacterized protein n=1 Tax=Byssothecium circinans TaxID=147558 RepID=A0A6A5UAU9_9PLEO|nr:hypothetical protein CC80DRAFT_531779 [Byssothecium circinans]
MLSDVIAHKMFLQVSTAFEFSVMLVEGRPSVPAAHIAVERFAFEMRRIWQLLRDRLNLKSWIKDRGRTISSYEGTDIHKEFQRWKRASMAKEEKVAGAEDSQRLIPGALLTFATASTEDDWQRRVDAIESACGLWESSRRLSLPRAATPATAVMLFPQKPLHLGVAASLPFLRRFGTPRSAFIDGTTHAGSHTNHWSLQGKAPIGRLRIAGDVVREMVALKHARVPRVAHADITLGIIDMAYSKPDVR